MFIITILLPLINNKYIKYGHTKSVSTRRQEQTNNQRSSKNILFRKQKTC